MSFKTRRLLICIVATFTLVGCGAKSPKPAGSEIEFDGRRWQLTSDQDMSGLSLGVWLPADVLIYKTNEEDIRLVGIRRHIKEGDDLPRKLAMISQKRINGAWKNHGKNYLETQDGCYGYTTYENGELNGPQEEFYPDGRLQVRRNHLNGKNHGRDEGWYQDGSKQWDSQYVMGKEITGKFWKQGEMKE